MSRKTSKLKPSVKLRISKRVHLKRSPSPQKKVFRSSYCAKRPPKRTDLWSDRPVYSKRYVAIVRLTNLQMRKYYKPILPCAISDGTNCAMAIDQRHIYCRHTGLGTRQSNERLHLPNPTWTMVGQNYKLRTRAARMNNITSLRTFQIEYRTHPTNRHGYPARSIWMRTRTYRGSSSCPSIYPPSKVLLVAMTDVPFILQSYPRRTLNGINIHHRILPREIVT